MSTPPGIDRSPAPVPPIPAPDPPPERRTSRPFPEHRYLPGVGPNPGTLGWAPTADFDFACDLFDHRHLWEAHEVWEAEWRPLAAGDPEKALLQGLICAAAFTIKRYQGFADASERILSRSRDALGSVVRARGPIVRGIDLPELLRRLDVFRGGGAWPVLPRR